MSLLNIYFDELTHISYQKDKDCHAYYAQKQNKLPKDKVITFSIEDHDDFYRIFCCGIKEDIFKSELKG